MSAPARSPAAFQRLKTDAGSWVRCLACGDIKFVPARAQPLGSAWRRWMDFLLRHQRGQHGPFSTETRHAT